MKLLYLFAFSLIVLSFSQQGAASACCGGGLTDSMILLGGERAQVSASYSNSVLVVDHVDTRGVWKTRDEHQIVETFTLDYEAKLSALWQMGLSVPVVTRSWMQESYTNIGDVGLFVGKDLKFDSPSSIWSPRTLATFHLTLPTGQNRAESEVGGLDSSGNGFWSAGFGLLLTKNFDTLDVWSRFRIHHSLDRDYSNSISQGNLNPGWGGDFSVGIGYNMTSWRLGSLVRSTYEDPIRVRGTVNAPGAPERMTTLALTADYTILDGWVIGGQVFDQTILGSPTNTSLGRGVSFSLVKKIL